jgi:sec-independent protein translocase protein TatA
VESDNNQQRKDPIMFGLGFQEILLLLLLALLLFGAAKLPAVGKALGEAIREFKKAMNSDSRDKTNDSESSKNMSSRGKK